MPRTDIDNEFLSRTNNSGNQVELLILNNDNRALAVNDSFYNKQ